VIVPARRAGAAGTNRFESYGANWRCCADLSPFIIFFIRGRLQRKASCSGCLARWFGFTRQSIPLRQACAACTPPCLSSIRAQPRSAHQCTVTSRPHFCLLAGLLGKRRRHACFPRDTLFATCVFIGRAPPTGCAALGFKFKKSANSGGESRSRRRALSLHGTLRT
jgi:hypothetical protein